MRPGYCAGLVASKEDGLIFPRTIVQVPDTRFFVVVDMGGWGPQRGRVLLLDPACAAGQAPQGADDEARLAARTRRRPGSPHLCRHGRTDLPLRSAGGKSAATVETIIQDLPGRKPKLSDGTVLDAQRASAQAFRLRPDRPALRQRRRAERRLRDQARRDQAVRGRRGRRAARRDLDVHAAGRRHFSGAEAGRHESAARGLTRAACATRWRSPRIRAFPTTGFAFLQGENARDLPDADTPNEEINALEKGKHYGWPYCYDLSTASPEFEAFLQARRVPAISATMPRATASRIRCCRRTARRSACCTTRARSFPSLTASSSSACTATGRPAAASSIYDVDDTRLPASQPAAGALQCQLRAPSRACFRPRARRRSRPRHSIELISRLAQGERRAAARRAGRHDGRGRRRDLARRGQEPDRHPHRRRAGRARREPLPCGMRTRRADR